MKILIWQARRGKKITLAELSKRSGLGKSTINNIENGKTSPTMVQMERIARALEMKISDLYESDCK